jgi:hypothetical protein
MQFIAQLSDWAADLSGRAKAALSVVGQATQEVATTAVEKVKEVVPNNVKTFLKETAQRVESAAKKAQHRMELAVLFYGVAYLVYCFLTTLAVFIPVLILLSAVLLTYFIKGLFIGMVLTILILEIDSSSKK